MVYLEEVTTYDNFTKFIILRIALAILKCVLMYHVIQKYREYSNLDIYTANKYSLSPTSMIGMRRWDLLMIP